MTGAPWSSGFGVVDGTRLHYQRTGGPSPVIVLLHGLADDGLCWIRVARRLEQTFDVVMPDARGHGQSDPIGSGGFSVPRLVADAAGLLDLLGIRNALLFGHSMGAITAAVLAADRPDLVRGLVLEDPPLDVPVPSPDDRRTRMRSDVGSWRDLTPAMRRKRVAEIHPGWARAETHPWLEAEVNVDLDDLRSPRVVRRHRLEDDPGAARGPRLARDGRSCTWRLDHR